MIRTSLAALALFAPVLALAQEPASETDFIRGVVRSTARVSIATDLAAPIVAMPLLDGERFSRGDVLVAFDCSRHAAQRRASEAAAQSASVELKQKSFLRKRGAAGQGEVDQARAEYARRQAEIDVARAHMRDCEIAAPFDGRVVEKHTRVHEMAKPGEPLMTIIDDAALEIELVVPSRWLRHIAVGAPFRFIVDETGDTVAARVLRIGAEVDPVSQTVKLTGSFDGSSRSILAGMSGNADFPRDEEGKAL